jgi:hypothetical protein
LKYRTKLPTLRSIKNSSVARHTPVFPALRRLRQEEFKFQGSLGYIVRTLSQKTIGLGADGLFL